MSYSYTIIRISWPSTKSVDVYSVWRFQCAFLRSSLYKCCEYMCVCLHHIYSIFGVFSFAFSVFSLSLSHFSHHNSLWLWLNIIIIIRYPLYTADWSNQWLWSYSNRGIANSFHFVFFFLRLSLHSTPAFTLCLYRLYLLSIQREVSSFALFFPTPFFSLPRTL